MEYFKPKRIKARVILTLEISYYKIFLMLFLMIALNQCVHKRVSLVNTNLQLWSKVDKPAEAEDYIVKLAEESYQFWLLDTIRLKRILDTDTVHNTSAHLLLPLPNGTLSWFSIKNSSIAEPELLAKYPELKTYEGQGKDDPAATTRFEFTPFGFKAIILSPDGTIYIAPYHPDYPDYYISYYKSGILSGHDAPFELQAPIKE
jgi:hypothetical protein